MKKIYIQYYGIIGLGIYLFDNIFLRSFKVSGLLYRSSMILIILLNLFILIKFRKEIKYKIQVILIYLLTWFLFRDVLQFLLMMTSWITLLITGLHEDKRLKILGSILFLLFLFCPSLFLIFFILIFSEWNYEEGDNCYKGTHYICENHYEIYKFSGGATDKMHYFVGKRYDLLKENDIINITYKKNLSDSKEQYEYFLKNKNCKKVEDKDGK